MAIICIVFSVFYNTYLYHKITNMKKITTSFKIMLLAVIVLVMVQSCIPNNSQPVNPTLTGTFNVDINSLGDSIYVIDSLNINRYGENKILWIDNDSLLFYVGYEQYPGFSTLGFFIGSKSISGNTYEYLNYNTLNASEITYLPLGVSVTHLDTSAHWYPFLSITYNPINYNQFDRTISSFEGTIVGFPITLRIPFNEDRYFVFRKQKSNHYQYYWVKANISYDSTKFAGNGIRLNGGYSLNILNGKYQMDSIIIGQ